MSVEVGLQGMCFDPALGTQRDNAFPSLKFPVYLMREILYKKNGNVRFNERFIHSKWGSWAPVLGCIVHKSSPCVRTSIPARKTGHADALTNK